MLNKITYEPKNRIFEDDFNVAIATVIETNIRAYKEKEIVKPLIPDKTVTYWGAVITLRFETGDVVDAVWKLDKTVISEHNDVPCIAVMKKRNKKLKSKNKIKIKESTIPTILRAAGVKEWADLIGVKVRIKSICGYKISKNGFCISPINENSGRWFYPHYFEFKSSDNNHPTCITFDVLLNNLKRLSPNISCENDVTDSDLRNIILERILKENRDLDGDMIVYNGVSYFVDALNGIIRITETDKTNVEISEISDDSRKPTPFEELIDFIEGWMVTDIDQAEQNQFKYRFTKLYDDAFGREEDNAGHDYGFIKMNKFMEKQNIGYKIKVVYTTSESPRHWVIVKHDWNV